MGADTSKKQMNENSNIHDEQFDKRLIEKFGKEMPYELPESYFENNPDRILNIARMSSGRKNYFMLNIGRRIAAAAAILIIAAFALVYMFSNNNEIESFRRTARFTYDSIYTYDFIDIQLITYIFY